MLLLYSPAVVLAVWSFIWSIGLTGNIVIITGLIVTAVTVILHCAAEFGKRRNGGPRHGR